MKIKETTKFLIKKDTNNKLKNQKTMTYFYTTNSWTSQPQISENQIEFWKNLSDKKNWRIVQLPNGFYQTECLSLNADGTPSDNWTDVTRRETLESAEAAIDGSIEHYNKRLEFSKGPKVIKTFK